MKKIQIILSIVFIFYGLAFSEEIQLEELIKESDTLSIEKCISIALQNHPSIIVAENSYIVSKSKLNKALSTYYPELNLRSTYTQSKLGENPTSDNYSGYVNLSQNIYDFGRRETYTSSQRLSTKASKEELVSIRQNIKLLVQEAYFNLLYAEESKKIADETFSHFEARLSQAKAFFDSGLKPKIELIKAQADLSSAKLDQIKAEGLVSNAKKSLTNAMGLSFAPEYYIENTNEDISLLENFMDSKDALNIAMENRADWKAMQMKVSAAQSLKNNAMTNYLPKLSADVNYGQTGDEFPLTNTWNASINFSIPLFSGFSTVAEFKEAKANLSIAKANLELLRVQIYMEIEKAIVNLHNTKQSIISAKAAKESSKENLEIANGRYNTGIGSSIEISDAIILFNKAKLAYIASLRDYQLALSNFDKVLGIDIK